MMESKDGTYQSYYVGSQEGDFFDKYKPKKKTDINKKEQKKQSKSRGKKTVNHNARKVIALLSVTIFFCSFLLIVIGLYNGTVSVSRLLNGQITQYHAVAVGSFEDKNQAYIYSNSLAIQGSADFVYYDKSNKCYTVLASCYMSENDAFSVSQKLVSEGIPSYTLVMEIPKLKSRKIEDEEKNFFDRLVRFVPETFFLLYQASVDISEGNISATDIKHDLEKLLIDVDTECEIVSRYTQTHFDTIALELCVFAKMLKAMLSNLVNTNVETGSYLSELRYAAILVVNGQQNLIYTINTL